MKLKTKANIDGVICFIASQKSAVLFISIVVGIFMSIINSVNAIANTPSQKASNLEFGFLDVILVLH
jgi:hypothetical protein